MSDNALDNFMQTAISEQVFKPVQGHALCSIFYMDILLGITDNSLADILWRGYLSALDKTHQGLNKNLFINAFNTPRYKDLLESPHHIPIICMHGAALRYLCEEGKPYMNARYYQRLHTNYGKTLKKLLKQYADSNGKQEPLYYYNLLQETLARFPLTSKMALNNSEYKATFNYVEKHIQGGLSGLKPLNIACLVRNVCLKNYNDIKESDPKAFNRGTLNHVYVHEQLLELLDIEFDQASWWPGLKLYASNFTDNIYKFLTDVQTVEDLCRPLETAVTHSLPSFE